MKNYNFIESIKEKFSNYQTYYQILGVNPNSITDEKVKMAYDNKCMQLNNMLKDYKSEGIQEVRELIQITLDDAYTALKTENSRKHYNELLEKINTSYESIETEETEEIDEQNEL